MSEKASVYTETKTDSHTTVHTKTHTPTLTEAAHRVLLFLTAALLTPVSQGQSEYSSNSATCFLSKRLYFQLTIHLFLITDLFFCLAGSNADEPT